MKPKNIIENLNEYLSTVIEEINSVDIAERVFGDIALLLPTYESDCVLHHDDIEYLADSIKQLGLCTEPKLSRGFIERGIDAPIYFYLDQGGIDFSTSSFKYARLAVQVAVIMARADKEVDEEELKSIESLIWRQEGIGKQEKIFLLAKARYLLKMDSAFDERYRDYLKIALNKQSVIERMEFLSEKAVKGLLEIAKEVAISNSYLDRKELGFIQDIYRVLGLHARKARKDIEEFAKNRYITLASENNETIDLFDRQVFEEIDDVIGDLILDFDEF